MKVWYVIGLGCAVSALAYFAGYSNGQRGCPAFAAFEAERHAAIDRDVSEMLAAPSDRELICDSIFELVVDGVNQEIMDEQAERDSWAD